MKKNSASKLSLRYLFASLRQWLNQVIEKKADHLSDCGWYPGPCQTEYPF